MALHPEQPLRYEWFLPAVHKRTRVATRLLDRFETQFAALLGH